METWVRSLSQTSFTGNFTVVPTGGWVIGFSPELVVDSGYSRSTPFGPVGAPRVLGIDSVGRSKKKNQPDKKKPENSRLDRTEFINYLDFTKPRYLLALLKTLI
ncbi:hypothetical protein HanIR_Chr07g0338521 [Helianthus annuus]|nr:hypothetical protein HanIR_Chr07g0338521 [Helianthus annuus]